MPRLESAKRRLDEAIHGGLCAYVLDADRVDSLPFARGVGVLEDVAQVGAAVLAAHLAVRAQADVSAPRAVEASGVGVPPGVVELGSSGVQRVRAALAGEVASLREVRAELPSAISLGPALAQDVPLRGRELLPPLLLRELVRILRPERRGWSLWEKRVHCQPRAARRIRRMARVHVH